MSEKPLHILGTHDDITIAQAKEVLANEHCVAFSLQADGHVGYIMPIGGVAAFRNAVSVPSVGVDIACGNCAIKTDIKLNDISPDISLTNPASIRNSELGKIATEIERTVSFGIGRKNNADDAPVDHDLFHDPAWYAIPNIGQYREDLKDKARRQLGTVGSGNHYVDVFVDPVDMHIWVGVHFGSRGLGHTIAFNYLALGQGMEWGDKAPEREVVISLDSEMGRDYWALMELCGQYAYAGREWVARKVVSILGGKELDMVHNHHNFAWKETHRINGVDEELIVVRKGATPAWPEQRGFVGGSMGDDAVILTGAGSVVMMEDHESAMTRIEQENNLYSTIHGAGRVMSRTEAAGKRNRKTGELKLGEDGKPVKPPRVSKEMMDEWLLNKGVLLRGGGVDESPHVYRRLKDVLASQGDTITVTNTLRPIIVCMAGSRDHDPYKD